ncbi:MAG TPA: cupin domain-containing protein [Gaiellaceae bacterium]|nr:cupin domain-containing protein [Gaiellaceae bacterium]
MKRPILQPRDDAPVHDVLGGSISVRLREEETGGRIALIENVIPARFDALPLHVHPAFDEAFYIVSGALTFTVGGETLTATPGALVWAPGEVPHTFRNYTTEPARLLLWTTPGGHERYFDAFVALAAAGPPAPSVLGELMSRHGISVVTP